jgi:hypothetical protein
LNRIDSVSLPPLLSQTSIYTLPTLPHYTHFIHDN